MIVYLSDYPLICLLISCMYMRHAHSYKREHSEHRVTRVLDTLLKRIQLVIFKYRLTSK